MRRCVPRVSRGCCLQPESQGRRCRAGRREGHSNKGYSDSIFAARHRETSRSITRPLDATIGREAKTQREKRHRELDTRCDSLPAAQVQQMHHMEHLASEGPLGAPRNFYF
jgi:hypothetical protein